MSCYLRYLKDFLEEVDLHPEDRKERKGVDLAIRMVVGMKLEDKCNVVWKEVKVWLHDENKKKELINRLK
ncbi:hypothetical protein [Methanobacterium petrolearium]|uniref:hypothetical protein n=1 Tax=Methanobacterium petrolearium TaxID=710190 RepID=UPI001AE84C76|nr:hypothetical protein [Methanobacterium petrolearium]MBP1946270.1 hypothetical protein [Methanobacterium petrolearium]BDZ71363.1 hypothetical protein GCM10025861_18800 [Methanobacterium petrolearium]